MRIRGIAKITLLLCLLPLLLSAVCFAAVEPAVPGQGVYDYAAVLTQPQLEKLQAEANAVEERQQMTLAVVFVNDIGARTPYEYADDFYDQNNFGVGASRDGILLLVSLVTRDIQISASGQAMLFFNDADTDRILDDVAPYLSEGDYAGAVSVFLNRCDAHITQIRASGVGDSGETAMVDGAEKPVVITRDGERVVFDENGTPVRFDNQPLRVRYGPLKLALIALLCGLGVGLLVIGIMAIVHKAGLSRAPGAQSYMPSEGFHLAVSTDRFLRTHTTRTAIPQNNSGGSSGGSFGGGSQRTSSSGRSHSGTGRKF